MSRPRIAVLRTSPGTVIADYGRLVKLAGCRQTIDRSIPTLVKLNLSWTKYFPACSTQPWQLDGVAKALLEEGYAPERLIPIENKTVVTEPWKGAENNRGLPVL